MDKAEKQEIIEKYRHHQNDTGSPEVQVALLTKTIAELTEHVKVHKHDNSTRRGLIGSVNKRRKLLRYLSREDSGRFKKISSTLGINL